MVTEKIEEKLFWDKVKKNRNCGTRDFLLKTLNCKFSSIKCISKIAMV